MTYVRLLLLCLVLILCPIAMAKDSTLASRRRTQMAAFLQLKVALRHFKSEHFSNAARQLFLLIQNPALKKQQSKIRYYLASSLYSMGFYHPAVLQMQVLVNQKNKEYIRSSLRKIASVAALLKDDKLLNYVIRHGGLKYIPGAEKQKLYYHLGEFWMRKNQFRKAIRYFARVRSTNPFFYKALYQIALAHAELNEINKAAVVFEQLENRRSGVTDRSRVAALMGKARAYYQGKKWNEAVAAYLEVPKDSVFWHDTLLERSWALLRGGRLRSSLSNFQTLHSAYYKDRYQPESLLLRAIIYLYICKYYEMEKVLDLFHKMYRPAYRNVQKILKSRYSPKTHYQSMVLSLDNKKIGVYVKYPTPVARRILDKSDMFAMHYYIERLKEERDQLHTLSPSWKRAKVGKYVYRVIRNRLNRAQKSAGQKIFKHLKVVHAELKDFFIQEKYIRYEMLRSKRGFLKKKIARKAIPRTSVEDFDRSFYIQNGYEYWPFKGEYWLDELGNYHYVGMGSCANK